MGLPIDSAVYSSAHTNALIPQAAKKLSLGVSGHNSLSRFWNLGVWFWRFWRGYLATKLKNIAENYPLRKDGVRFVSAAGGHGQPTPLFFDRVLTKFLSRVLTRVSGGEKKQIQCIVLPGLKQKAFKLMFRVSRPGERSMSSKSPWPPHQKPIS